MIGHIGDVRLDISAFGALIILVEDVVVLRDRLSLGGVTNYALASLLTECSTVGLLSDLPILVFIANVLLITYNASITVGIQLSVYFIIVSGSRDFFVGVINAYGTSLIRIKSGFNTSGRLTFYGLKRVSELGGGSCLGKVAALAGASSYVLTVGSTSNGGLNLPFTHSVSMNAAFIVGILFTRRKGKNGCAKEHCRHC